MMDELRQDLRDAWRVLLRRPGLTLAALASLALGIGANSTVFSFVNALLLPELPVSQPQRLVSIHTRDAKTPALLPASYPNYLDWRAECASFEGLLARRFIGVGLGAGRDATPILAELVSGNYFDVLGVRPSPGRGFRPEEDRPGAAHVAVLSHALWRRRFGADPALVGATVVLSGAAFTVVGIAPSGFSGTQIGLAPDAWVPVAAHPVVMPEGAEWITERRALSFDVIGRLKPGVRAAAARDELQALARRLEQEYPSANKGREATLVPLAQSTIAPGQRGGVVLASGFLMVIVALVLLIACANVANLLLARAAARSRESAMRVALGATRGRLVRRLLTESLLLALGGGALGVLLAYWATRAVWGLRPPSSLPISLDPTPDGRVLAFTVVVSLVSAVVFGLAPALRASRVDLVHALKDDAPAPARRRAPALKNLLVVSQVGLSLVLLVAAMLFARSLRAARLLDPGFSTRDVVVLPLDLALYGYDQPRARAFLRRVLDETGALPGVRSASLAQVVPLGGGALARTVYLPDSEDEAGGTLLNVVGPRYFETLGIALVQGRGVSDADREDAPAVAVVNSTFAAKFWPGQNPLGRRFRFYGQEGWREVVGVARDSTYSALGESPRPQVFLPFEQTPAVSMTLHVRAASDPAGVVAAVRGAVQALDDSLPVGAAVTLDERLARSLWPARVGAAVLGFFGVLGLLLTAVGVYGVLTHSVAQRTHEIGIRVAIGGGAREVRRLVLRQGLRLVAVGLTAGALLAAVLTRALTGLLYGVDGRHPAVLVVPVLVLGVVSAVAVYLPARRATRVDPAVALRCE